MNMKAFSATSRMFDSADDVAEIQAVIRNSGLIASMKAYQPQIMLVSQR